MDLIKNHFEREQQKLPVALSHSDKEQLKSTVTKVAYGYTDQCFAESRDTLHDHGKG